MRFEVGEVAIYIRPGSKNFGKEVTIVGPLKWARLWTPDLKTYKVVETYNVSCDDLGQCPKGRWAAQPHHLRKKPPKAKPKEEVGEWELCPWQPTAQTVEVQP